MGGSTPRRQQAGSGDLLGDLLGGLLGGAGGSAAGGGLGDILGQILGGGQLRHPDTDGQAGYAPTPGSGPMFNPPDGSGRAADPRRGHRGPLRPGAAGNSRGLRRHPRRTAGTDPWPLTDDRPSSSPRPPLPGWRRWSAPASTPRVVVSAVDEDAFTADDGHRAGRSAGAGKGGGRRRDAGGPERLAGRAGGSLPWLTSSRTGTCSSSAATPCSNSTAVRSASRPHRRRPSSAGRRCADAPGTCTPGTTWLPALDGQTRTASAVATTEVEFADLDDAEIEAYVATGEPGPRRRRVHDRRARRGLRHLGHRRPAQRRRHQPAAAAPPVRRTRSSLAHPLDAASRSRRGPAR